MVLMTASLPCAWWDPETTMYSFQGDYWNRDRGKKNYNPQEKNTYSLGVTDSPREDDSLCICL